MTPAPVHTMASADWAFWDHLPRHLPASVISHHRHHTMHIPFIRFSKSKVIHARSRGLLSSLAYYSVTPGTVIHVCLTINVKTVEADGHGTWAGFHGGIW
jgi:hypothetical protein